MHYHHKTNLDCFLHNGFISEDTENDVFPLDLGISPSDKLFQKRSDVLKKLQMSTNETFFLQDSLQPFETSLLKFLRVFCMDGIQLDNVLNDQRSPQLLAEFEESKEHVLLEIKAWKFLDMRLKLLLASFKTSVDDDLKKMQEKLSSNERLAIQMRICDKKLLAKISAFISSKLRLFEQI